jgi:hypothetical protein
VLGSLTDSTNSVSHQRGHPTRPAAIIQICNYSEHVARVQGRQPKYMHIVLGDGTLRRYSVNSFSAYYRVLVQAFREHRFCRDKVFKVEHGVHIFSFS